MPRAAVIAAPGGPVEVRDFPRPDLEPGGVLVDTICSEVCGTDVHLFHGRLGGVPYPLIPGHISVGRVVESRDAHDVDGEDVRPGEVVTFLDVHGTCHDCWYCLVAKASTRCPSRKVYGITYGADEGLLGGWSEQIYLLPGVKIVKLPPDLEPRTYIAGGCGMPTALHAIDRGEVRIGETVAVQGCGPVGLTATALARIAGAGKVITLGQPSQRLDVAEALGADVTINIDDVPADDRPAAVREFTGGRGADVTIEATGVPGAVVEGMRMTRDAGRYVVVGQYTDAGDVTLNPHLDLNQKHLDVRGTWGIDLSHLHRSVAILARHQGTVPWQQVVSRDYSLEQADDALHDVETRRVVKAVIAPNG
ncbi:MAG TPA: zinc-binding dehydrogenase [Armatimonadota bacterium]|nr:zinc-binding dehydrogenase [Armatimonadota bacterium]